MKDLEIAFAMLFCDPTPISSKDVEEIKPENWSNEDTGKVLAWTKAQLNGKKWKSATYNYKKQEKRTKQVEIDTERAKERFSKEWLRTGPVTGEKRKAESSIQSDSHESGNGRINRRNHLKRPKLQDDLVQGQKRKLPLKDFMTRNDFVGEPQQTTIEKIWSELEQTALGTDAETPIFDSIIRRLENQEYPKNIPTAKDLSKWLHEPNIEQLQKLYDACGAEFMLKCYLHTVYVELRGGMSTDMNAKQQRRRTSGGVFFRITRWRYHLTDEQVEARDKIIDDNFLTFQDQCLQEIQSGGSVSEKLLCQLPKPEPSGPLYEPN